MGSGSFSFRFRGRIENGSNMLDDFRYSYNGPDYAFFKEGLYRMLHHLGHGPGRYLNI